MVRRLACALILLCASFPARASVITFDTLLGVIEHDTYNGLVGATVDGEFYNLVCNDYYATTDVPSGPWDFNVSTLPGLTFARFGNDAAGVARYQQAALLLAGDGNTVAGLMNVADSYSITAHQYAIWNLFGAGVDDVNNSSALLLATFNALSNGIDYSSTYAALRVYTPAESAIANQEFLGLGDRAVHTPEPGSMVLLATGLLGMTVVFRKKYRVLAFLARRSSTKGPAEM